MGAPSMCEKLHLVACTCVVHVCMASLLILISSIATCHTYTSCVACMRPSADGIDEKGDDVVDAQDLRVLGANAKVAMDIPSAKHAYVD